MDDESSKYAEPSDTAHLQTNSLVDQVTQAVIGLFIFVR